MDKSIEMTGLVDRLLYDPLLQDVSIIGDTVEFVSEAKRRQDCADTPELGLSKDERQNRGEKIDIGYTKKLSVTVDGVFSLHLAQQSRRKVLTPGTVKGPIKVKGVHVVEDNRLELLFEPGSYCSPQMRGKG